MLFVSIVGDSISTYEGYNPIGYSVFYNKEMQTRNGLTSVYDTWWAKVNQYLKAYYCVNNSYSGSRVSGEHFPAANSVERTSSLHTSQYQPDIILIYIGFNDFGGGVPIHERTPFHFEKNPCFFHSAYDLMLKRIKTNYPNAKIICATLMRGYIKGRPEWIFPETYGGVLFDKYNDSIRRACKQQKCLLADLAKSGHQYETLDGTHPTIVGHFEIAKEWIHWLEGNADKN